jgi:hypothetical protein
MMRALAIRRLAHARRFIRRRSGSTADAIVFFALQSKSHKHVGNTITSDEVLEEYNKSYKAMKGLLCADDVFVFVVYAMAAADRSCIRPNCVIVSAEEPENRQVRGCRGQAGWLAGGVVCSPTADDESYFGPMFFNRVALASMRKKIPLAEITAEGLIKNGAASPVAEQVMELKRTGRLRTLNDVGNAFDQRSRVYKNLMDIFEKEGMHSCGVVVVVAHARISPNSLLTTETPPAASELVAPRHAAATPAAATPAAAKSAAAKSAAAKGGTTGTAPTRIQQPRRAKERK